FLQADDETVPVDSASNSFLRRKSLAVAGKSQKIERNKLKFLKPKYIRIDRNIPTQPTNSNFLFHLPKKPPLSLLSVSILHG
ncbi:hypothetical protein, partial [Alistipes ihumii]|uniref:hypothetical protein n=2 Tax=Alistipes ihumii TaxID=1470347 RepID=UPI003AF835EB